MPYTSQKQRRFMYSQHPEIAERWDREGKNKIVRKKTRIVKKAKKIKKKK